MSLDKVKVVCKEPNNPDVKDSALNVKQLATPFKNLIYKSCFIKLAFAYKILSRQSGQSGEYRKHIYCRKDSNIYIKYA